MTTSPNTTQNTPEEPNNERTQDLDPRTSTPIENRSEDNSESVENPVTKSESDDFVTYGSGQGKTFPQTQWVNNYDQYQDTNIPPKPDYPPTAHERQEAVVYNDQEQEKVTVTTPNYSHPDTTSSYENYSYQDSYPPTQDYSANNNQYPPTQMNYGKQTNVMALTSMIVSLGSILFGGLFAIAGVILGHIAIKQIDRTGEEGKGFALTGLIAGYVQIGLWVLGGILFLFIAMMAIASS